MQSIYNVSCSHASFPHCPSKLSVFILSCHLDSIFQTCSLFYHLLAHPSVMLPILVLKISSHQRIFICGSLNSVLKLHCHYHHIIILNNKGRENFLVLSIINKNFIVILSLPSFFCMKLFMYMHVFISNIIPLDTLFSSTNHRVCSWGNRSKESFQYQQNKRSWFIDF